MAITRKFEQGPFIITVKREYDEYADVSFLDDASRYEGCTPEETAEYLRQDKARTESYGTDWWMESVCVDVAIKTAQNWAIPHIVGRASLSGIESDSDESYFKSTEDELIEEALADAKTTYEAMQQVFNS